MRSWRRYLNHGELSRQIVAVGIVILVLPTAVATAYGSIGTYDFTRRWPQDHRPGDATHAQSWELADTELPSTSPSAASARA